ncbi:transposase [Streptomyces luteogriseus]|nr:transposase [Streptomyces luteogriseus]
MPDRQALCGILFVLHTGIRWEYLPLELGFGSGTTCWRRLAAWKEAGVRNELHLVLMKKNAERYLHPDRPQVRQS